MTDTLYSIPKNWRWTTLENVCKFIGGGTPNKKAVEYWKGNIFWASVKDIKGDYLFETVDKITEQGLENSSANLCEIDDLILITRIEPAKTIIAKVVTAINQDLKIVKSPLPPKFLHYFFQNFKSQIELLSSGTTVKGITIEKLNNFPIPVPPLAEQERIVECLDSLFKKLDAAKKILQDIVDGYELRRAAILHRAFTGELTEDFRKKNNLSLDDWQEKTFKEICTVVRGGSPRPAGSPKYYGGTIPFMKVADITNNHSPYIYSAKNTITEAGLTKTRMVKANTLLLTNSGATLGVPAICKIDTTLNDGIAAFLNLDSSSLLFYYFFWCSKTQELRAINKGAAQPNLNTNIIGDVKINLPPLEEQKEIARRLDSLLGKENQAKEIAENLLSEIETLKKTILARAFRGELGTNAPEDID